MESIGARGISVWSFEKKKEGKKEREKEREEGNRGRATERKKERKNGEHGTSRPPAKLARLKAPEKCGQTWNEGNER